VEKRARRFLHRDVVRQRRVLEMDADELEQIASLAAGVEPQDAERPAGRRTEAGEALHRGGLVGSVRSHDAEHLAGENRERHVIDRRHRPISLAQVPYRDDLAPRRAGRACRAELSPPRRVHR